jgi:hypothetical protein
LPRNPEAKEDESVEYSKNSSILSQEEFKNYQQRKHQVQATDFDGSDNEVY